MGDLIVIGILLVVVCGAVTVLRRDRQKGGGCTGNCACCGRSCKR